MEMELMEMELISTTTIFGQTFHEPVPAIIPQPYI